MIKTLYMLLAISSGGDEFVIDSQLTASDCISAMAANPEPFKMDIGGTTISVETLECEIQP